MTSTLDNNRHLTSGRLLARNSLWNLFGNGAPILVAVFSIPVLIRGLGTERFGVLTLTWAVIGYASLFDLGLGRALTQLVARKLGDGDEREIPSLVWTSLLLMLLLGLLGTVAVVSLTPWLVKTVLHIPDLLKREALSSFYLLGFSIPVVIMTVGLRGFLEAHQRFSLINALRIPVGVFTFVGPLLVLPFSKDLTWIVVVLTLSRFVSLIAHLILCLRVAPSLRGSQVWDRTAVGPLLRFGGWMTVSNIIGPLMVTLDRFLIGALLSLEAVAYYATPYEVVTKFLLIPSALMSVMFPAFSTSFVQDRTRTVYLFRGSVKYILLVLFPITLLVIVLAKDGLQLWVGPDFALRSTHVLQWLAVGVFINSLAQVPFAVLQGVGRPDLTAKLHAIEFPGYLVMLVWLTRVYGIEGAAIAWTARVVIDALILFRLANRFLPVAAPLNPRVILLIPLSLLTIAVAPLPQSIVLRAIFLLLTIIGFLLISWFQLLSPEERNLAQKFL